MIFTICCKINECREYIATGNFRKDFNDILDHDKDMFDEPKGWGEHKLSELTLLKDTESIWNEIAPIYRRELSDLAFAPLPPEREILDSFLGLISKILK